MSERKGHKRRTLDPSYADSRKSLQSGMTGARDSTFRRLTLSSSSLQFRTLLDRGPPQTPESLRGVNTLPEKQQIRESHNSWISEILKIEGEPSCFTHPFSASGILVRFPYYSDPILSTQVIFALFAFPLRMSKITALANTNTKKFESSVRYLGCGNLSMDESILSCKVCEREFVAESKS